MRKHDLAKLALLGVSASLAFGCQKTEAEDEYKNGNQMERPASDKMQAFRNNLSPAAQKKFDELSPARQAAAMEMAEAKCQGPNACQGEAGRKINNEAVDTVYEQQKNEKKGSY